MKHGSLISPDEASFSFGPSSFAPGSFAPKADAGSMITVPDAGLLFNGDFTRAGDDLKITGDNGQSFLVEDYFRHDKRPTLLSPEGASLTGDVVDALAGPLAPGQYAQAGGAQSAGEKIGRVEKVEGSATVIRNGVAITLNAGDVVMKGDVVQTGTGGQVAILFADGSTFSLSSNARMVLNDFVYQEGGANNSALISLVQGTIGFVAGQVAKTGDMRVDTPVATMGIRGTAVLVEISANNGETSFSVLVEPDGTTGSFNLYNKSTGTLLGTVNSSTIGWVVTPAGPLQVLAQQMQKTPGEVQQELNFFQHIFNIFQQGQQNPFDPDQHTSNPQGTQTAGTQFLIFDGGLPQTGDSGNNNGIVIVTVGGGEGGNGNNHGGLLDVPDFVNFPPIALPDGNPHSGGSSGHTSSVIEAGVQQPDNAETAGTPTASGNVIDNDTDPNPGDILTLTNIRSLSDELHGSLSINSLGAYTYTLDNDKAAYLAEGETAVDLFEYTITDAFGATATATLRIVIFGTNDAPVIVDANGNEIVGPIQTTPLTEAANQTGEACPPLKTEGSIAFKDVDLSDNNHQVFFSVTASIVAGVVLNEQALRDMFEANVVQTGIDDTDGSIEWEFSANDSAFDYLAEGEEVTLTYTLTLTDDEGATDTQDVVITITGTNDEPVITDGPALVPLEEPQGPTIEPAFQESGTLQFEDADVSDDGHTVSVALAKGGTTEGLQLDDAALLALLGTTVNTTTAAAIGSIDWSFNASDDAFEYLAKDEQITLTYTITLTDEHQASAQQTVAVTITGTNDAPMITTETAQEADLTESSVLSDTGAISFSDVDKSNDLTVSHDASNAAVDWSGGTLSSDQIEALRAGFTLDQTAFDNTGTVNWTYSVPEQTVDFLGQGETITFAVAVTVTDEASTTDSHDVTVTITGTNDAPTLIGNLSATVTAGSSYTLQIGDLDFTDPDDIAENVTFQISNLTNGEIFVDQGAEPVTSFTGKQLKDGDVTFVEDGNGATSASFQVSVEDGNEDDSPPATATFNFNVTPAEVAAPEVTAVVHTPDGFDTSSLSTMLLDSDLVGIDPAFVSLQFADGSYLKVTTEGLTWTEENGETTLTGGTIKDVLIYRMVDNQQVDVASFEGFNISATHMQAAINYYDQNNQNTAALDVLLAEYSYDMTGGDGVDTLAGGNFGDTLSGGPEDDALIGGSGNDSFVFSFVGQSGFDHDNIIDFHAGNPQIPGAEMDKIIFTDSPYANFAELQEDMSQEGNVVTITHDDGQITLTLADGYQLTAANFIFQQPDGINPYA